MSDITTTQAADDLSKRVQQFNLLQLPGQPLGMHMGTSYLVNDLWREVERLHDAAKGQLVVVNAAIERAERAERALAEALEVLRPFADEADQIGIAPVSAFQAARAAIAKAVRE